MTVKEVVFSLCDHAKEFVREYENSKLEQKVIDAIVVDYINYFAAMHCNMDLAMFTKDLRDGKKMSEPEKVLQKDIILPTLKYRKDNYYKFGIIKSVNHNKDMNECDGNANVKDLEALEVIDDFIKSYMSA